MNASEQPAYEFLVEQLSLLDRLAESLRSSQSAMLTGDLSAFEKYTAHQMDLCQTLKRGRKSADSVCASPESMPDSPEVRKLEAQVRAMEERVSQLNRVHACLLARARKSLAILRHILVNQCLTYASDCAGADPRIGAE